MICVLGSTGQLGLPMTKQLVAAGQSVRCLAHTEKSAEILRREVPGVEIVVGDMTNREDLRRVMTGCDQLFIAGPGPISFGQFAELLSQRLGRPITYVKNTFEEAEQDLRDVGLNAYGAKALRGLYQMYERGDMNDTGDGVEKMTGHPPRSINDFLDDFIGFFK